MTTRTVVWACVAVCLACATGCAVGPADEGETGVAQEALSGQFCGGIAGIACPAGYECVDDPSDSCDPASGGADCGGVCRRGRCEKRYVGHSPAECSVIRFVCDEGTHYFSDRNGCGCECDRGNDAWCVYAGHRYHVGQSFPATDGCNTCSCSEGGFVACTLRYCTATGI